MVAKYEEYKKYKKYVIKTHMKKPPSVLEYWWAPPGEPEPVRFPVSADGILEGLTIDYPRFRQLEIEWKLEVIEVAGKSDSKSVPAKAESVGKEV